MELANVINIIGITAYSLLAIFFLWVNFVPNTVSKTHYWLIAIILMLSARLNLYFLPPLLSEQHIQFIYALLIVLEKVFLILGLLFFVIKSPPQKYIRALLLFSTLIILVLFLAQYIFNHNTFFRIVFSISQAIFILTILLIFFIHRHKLYIKNQPTILFLLVLYIIHWLSFPIAVNYPVWLSLGYLFGNVLNLVIYLSLAYLVLERFQYRILKAEQSALELLDEAKKANTAKSEFLANMSHEIRTPMNGVLGMLELLERSDLTKQQMHQVKIALSSGKSLLGVINDILDFSKIEAGELKLEQIEFDIVNLLEEIANVMQNLAEVKGIEFIIDTSCIDAPLIKSDPLRLKQILLNLLGNAVKFTEHGEVLLQAKFIEQQGTTSLVCTINDTGIGIEPAKLAKIFESFNQADSSTTRNFGGTGLGLSISKKLCSLLNGNIAVQSTLGVGSTFTMTLPIEKSQHQKNIYDPKAITHLNVLIVDDNETNLEVMSNLLEFWQIKSTSVNSGEKALALCTTEHEFDIAILDMQMPNMDGEQLGQKIKSLPSCTNLPLVMLSSISDQALEQRVLNTNFDKFMRKPVLFSNLFNVLQEIVNQKEPKDIVREGEIPLLPDWPNNTKILLVEDNRINQVVAVQLLQHFNLSCDIANNGAEAIAKLKVTHKINHLYDIILMDCQMPILDGYETTIQIRQGVCGAKYTNVPIIAMTANAMKGDREKCLSIGMDDYIAKPLDKELTLQVLKQWIIKEETES